MPEEPTNAEQIQLASAVQAPAARPLGPTRGSQPGAEAGRRALEGYTSAESDPSGDR